MAPRKQSEQFSNGSPIPYLANFPGANPAENTVEVTIEGTKDLIEVAPTNDITIGEILEQVEVTVPGTVTVDAVQDPLNVSAATVNVQEDTPLDVSASTVSVQEDTPLDVSAATVPVEHQGVIDVSSRDSRNLGDVDVTDLPNSDRGDWNSASLSADGSLSIQLGAIGADRLRGRVVSSGSYDVEVAWLAEDGTELFTEQINSGVAGGTETTIDLLTIGAEAIVRVIDASSAAQTVDGVLHLA